jgi:hypothetical protein
MNFYNISHAALRPRSDAIQFLLSSGFEHSMQKDSCTVDIDYLVHEYMLFGPPHSVRWPFPSELDLESSLLWLQENGYIFLSGDSTIALCREAHPTHSKASAYSLCQAVDTALEHLKTTPLNQAVAV